MGYFHVGLSNYVALEITCSWHTHTHIYKYIHTFIYIYIFFVSIYCFYTWCRETHIALTKFINTKEDEFCLKEKKNSIPKNIWLKDFDMEGTPLLHLSNRGGGWQAFRGFSSPASGVCPQLWLWPRPTRRSRSVGCRSPCSWRPTLLFLLSLLRCF